MNIDFCSRCLRYHKDCVCNKAAETQVFLEVDLHREPAINVLLTVEKISLPEVYSKELRILSRETNVPVNVYIKEAIGDFLKKRKKGRK